MYPKRQDKFLHRAASFWYVLRLADGFLRSNDHNLEFSSHPLTQRLIGARTYLSAAEKRQLLVRSSKRRVNFLIIILQLSFAPLKMSFISVHLLHTKKLY